MNFSLKFILLQLGFVLCIDSATLAKEQYKVNSESCNFAPQKIIALQVTGEGNPHAEGAEGPVQTWTSHKSFTKKNTQLGVPLRT